MTRMTRFIHRDDVRASYDRATGNVVIQSEQRPVSPLLIDICITKRCGAGCSYCYMNAGSDGESADPYYIADGLKALPVLPFSVALGGGEPAHKDSNLLQVGSQLHILGVDVAFTTACGDPQTLNAASHMTGVKAVGISYHNQEQFLRSLFSCDGKGVAHLVLFEDKLDDYAELFQNFWWPEACNGVVLLLPKPVGRGKHVQVPSRQRILDFIETVVRPWWAAYKGAVSVAIDPCMGSIPFDMDLPLDPNMLLSGCDGGQYSMYWDAVDKKIGRCSFLQDELVPWDGTRSEFDRIWASWQQVQGCPYQLRV